MNSILKIIVAQAAFLAVLLIALDLGLWGAFPIEKDLKFKNFELTQHENGLKSRIKYEEIGPYLRSLSMKDLHKPKDTLRILCLGASTTIQLNQETQDSWCGLIEIDLKAVLTGVNIQTVSHGADGDKTIDSAYWLKQMMSQIKPDIVVTLLGINDLAWSGGPGYRIRSMDTIESGQNHRSTFSYLKQLCTDISQICRRAQIVWHELIIWKDLLMGTKVKWDPNEDLPGLRSFYRAQRYVSDLSRAPDPIEEFHGALAWLLRFLKQNGVSVVVMGQPVLWKPHMVPDEYNKLWFTVNTPSGRVRPSTSWLAKEMQKYNEIQRIEVEKLGFSYVDLDAVIPKTIENYFDDCHFTDRGSKRVAEAVLPTLRKLLQANQVSLVDGPR